MKKGLVKKGQIWEDRNTGRRIVIKERSSGNNHWTIVHLRGKGDSRHLHEGTIQRFYTLVK